MGVDPKKFTQATPEQLARMRKKFMKLHSDLAIAGVVGQMFVLFALLVLAAHWMLFT